MKFKTVLVTGAGGYIGFILVNMLLKKNYKVIALDRFFFGNYLKNNKNLKIVIDDTRIFKINNIKNIDVVIDLAAISNDPSGDLFPKATKDINYLARYRLAKDSKKYGVKFYLLPSSCSVYGFSEEIVNENSKTNPLSLYAKYNLKAEKNILPLADQKFNVTIIRQATVFGYSERMRYDLAINALTYDAHNNKSINLMRSGLQWRPFVHIKDTCRAMIHLIEFSEKEKINKQIFNVGDNNMNFQIKKIGKIFKQKYPKIKVNWYGDDDNRSYKISFDKISKVTDFKCKYDLAYGIQEISNKLLKNQIPKTDKTLTLKWYKYLEECKKDFIDKSLNKKMINY
tara:strand:- start:2829 stop:3851 length:1023 start_codon:yes stop_codon:yes gene_type:complete